eukprot:TRINITY_DN13737_c0_g1_i1.p1 TRINITY_DN13737_c0_g1~~TRINITY_DN13737_c0_g1_i1.p1  ORF type:complete len:111 (+),score=30.10 TRINITY_DN13737_c0_g1_i1:117-449(+)
MDYTYGEKPPHPVINPNPTFKVVLKNFGLSEYLWTFCLPTVSLPYSYIAARKDNPGTRKVLMVFGAIVGLSGGFLLAYQRTSFKLMGLRENKDLVAKYSARLRLNEDRVD